MLIGNVLRNAHDHIKSAKAEAIRKFGRSFSIAPPLSTNAHIATMASRSIPLALRTSRYVCDSCLGASNVLNSARVAATRTLRTASSSQRKSAITRQHTSLSSRHVYRPHTRRPRLVLPSKRRMVDSHTHSPAESTQSPDLNLAATGSTPLLHRRLISLSGPEAAKFLQGLITNNVDPKSEAPFYSAFLDARGRMLWDVFIWVWPELVDGKHRWACYIEVDAHEEEALRKHLKKHKLRSKIEIKTVPMDGPNGIRVWAAWGDVPKQVQQWKGFVGYHDPRSEGLYRYLANADRDTLVDGLEPVDAEHYRALRYVMGIPEGQGEIPRESALPLEYNVDLSGGIDFKKGCYVGQELTIRTKHTGVVRKRVLPVQLHEVTPDGSTEDSQFIARIEPSLQMPESGTDIKTLDANGNIKKGRAVGKFIGGIGNVGLALCRLENMTSMRVSAEGGTYKDGMEFGVEVDGKILKVVPVLSDWFVQRKKDLWDTKKDATRKVLQVEEDDEEPEAEFEDKRWRVKS